VADITEVITDWFVNGHAGLKTIMFFDGSAPIGNIRNSLHNLWNAVDDNIASSARWTVATSGKTLDSATGDLTGVWSEAVPHTQVGSMAGETVADSVQVLLRWRTPTIVNSRFLAGHTFVPGLHQSNVQFGNLKDSVLTAMNAAATLFASESNGFVIWHRPSGPGATDGEIGSVVAGSCWQELAVLRRRRV